MTMPTRPLRESQHQSIGFEVNCHAAENPQKLHTKARCARINTLPITFLQALSVRAGSLIRPQSMLEQVHKIAAAKAAISPVCMSVS